MPCFDGLGNLRDGRPLWTGDFSGQGKTEVLFYYPGDGNWWLGTLNGTEFAGNSGRPFNSRVRLHVKLLTAPTAFTIDQMVQSMREVYRSVNIMVEVGSTENLTIADQDIEVGACVFGQTTQEQRDLFDNRDNVGVNDVAVYVARTVISNGRALNGCAAHDGRPSCVIARAATQWTMAHEVGHVLGLRHVDDNDRLMTGNGTANITNPPPDLIESERQTMESSAQTQLC
ncbi:Matrixin [Nonomuraea solani]|uniref:Matrixin n=1 Tax=Nonomuraea solani TaxID=1144553 RepID=A0A1H6CJA4_9ACTN|nr:matrixin family metalloprotease [Nonomuraea solani]SEG73002.1 Matrixin [Nonomuraea solani]